MISKVIISLVIEVGSEMIIYEKEEWRSMNASPTHDYRQPSRTIIMSTKKAPVIALIGQSRHLKYDKT
jgi:hypothetical protein